MKPIRTEADIDDLLRAAKALAVITAWNDAGLFQALADGPQTLGSLDGDGRSLATTAPILKHLGLLCGEGDRVALTETAARLLADGALPTTRNLEFLANLSKMDEVLREGGPVRGPDGKPQVTDGGVRKHDLARTAAFLDMLYRRSETSVEHCFEWLGPLLPAAATVLDVGGGHGRYVRRFVDAGHQGALFDFAPVVEYAQGRHGESLSYISGDFRDRETQFGGGYDLILLSNIVHGEPADENQSLLNRLAKTLNPGGYLVIKDMFLDAHDAGPENAALFGLTMLFHTRAGQSPSITGASNWLREAGLVDVELTTFERFDLLRARRPV